ncbi:MAG TPA: efflux RND transporter permease subunit [Casimicrobiaceae bacterium]|nr:efflux RND transporter permease subunit [Casimicrobiaceae bacterium]
MTPIRPPGAPVSGGLNLSEWALHHRPIVLFMIVVAALMGAFAYTKLGQSEDPPFTFKVMVVRTDWPGATAREVEEQVTDRIERKLQELPAEYIRSYSTPGESLVFIALRDSMRSSEVPEQWYQVRKKIGDIRGSLPAGIRGPYFNDEFGDTYTNIYAVTGDGFGYRDLKSFGDKLRAELLRVPGVAKVDFIGEQEERVFIEFSNAKLATLGLDAQTLIATLAAQNAVAPAGAFETPTDRIFLRPSGGFESVDAIRSLSLRSGDRTFRLGDIAEVRRGYVDPPRQKMRWRGREALGLGVTMVKGGDVIELGGDLERTMARLRAELPVGAEVDTVASMPQAVQRSINEFVRSLAEAVAIVLVVSLASLGLRTGLVVAVSIPLVLATTFLLMDLLGIGLHKISLGALVLSLGLLVDDAIIAVEMMAVKLEQGYDRFRAASHAWTSTAFPMLTGTLVTVAGFLPIATARSSTGEYTRSLFEVSAIALVVSWVVAVIVIPYLGYRMLPDFTRPQPAPAWQRLWARLRGRPAPAARPVAHDPEQVYRTPFYVALARLLDWTVAHRVLVIGVALAAFVASIAAFRFVPQQFFPSSSRPELLVDLRLPEGSSFGATLAQAQAMEAILARDDGIASFVGYVGSGSPRFYLPLDQQLTQSNFAQFVVVAKDNRQRERVRERLLRLFETQFPALRGRVSRLENGPPVGFPVQFRVSGDDAARVHEIARAVRAVMERSPDLVNVQFDWDEPSKVVRLVVDQDKARLLGLSSQDVAQFLNTSVSGVVVTQFREDNKLIDVVLRGVGEERAQLSFLRDLAIPTRSGRAVPITQVARLETGLEPGIVWRRDRQPTVTVRADVRGDVQGPDATKRLAPQLDGVRAGLPAGYRVESGGAVEDAGRGQRSIVAGVPLLVLTVLTLLMLQLKSFSRTLMVVLTAPLGLIGVTAGLLAFRMPFGFVAMLGTIALSGIIMRNSVILVDQIEQDVRGGATAWDAIVGATVRRFRPIVLTAAAAVLAMVPLARSDFFGPMAVAMMGGIVVATVLTLGFLPALYALWFRVRREPPADPAVASS